MGNGFSEKISVNWFLEGKFIFEHFFMVDWEVVKSNWNREIAQFHYQDRKA